ncbi:MAG: hypothetical protein ACTSXQ_05915 [Alphaproteobacteria bacterium]
MKKKTPFISLLLTIAFLIGIAASVNAQVPDIGPSGPTGWCTDNDGNNFPC